jgi:micrococcal nuclease
VVDGDTVELADGTRVRILLVDTPEATHTTECWGREATRYTRALLTGATVQLTADVETTDRYGRALRYLEVDGQDVSEDLVWRGHACVLHIPPNGAGRVERLRALERDARRAGRGLWGACRVPPC